MNFQIEAIGYVRGGRVEATDDDWGKSRAAIELDPGLFSADALLGLDSFSHAEVVFIFDRVPVEKVERSARHPRVRTN